MLRTSIVFFIIGLVAYLFGAVGLAGVSIEIGRLLLIVFVILALVSFVLSIFRKKGPPLIP
jgi:uncharacterized membrane protein YtjA (UPF0391 family)